MTVDEIKLRQMVNQHLLSTGDKLTVVKDLCGAQAQFYSNAVHALKIRYSEPDKEIFSNGLAKTGPSVGQCTYSQTQTVHCSSAAITARITAKINGTNPAFGTNAKNGVCHRSGKATFQR